MTKRSTIGTNPLDEIIPNPFEGTISDQSGKTEPSTFQEGEKQGNVSSSAGEHHATTLVLRTKDTARLNFPASQKGVAHPSQPEVEILPPANILAERVSELEEENLCLKWALGLILAPLALLALLG